MTACSACNDSESQHEETRYRRLPDGRIRAKNPCSVRGCGCPNYTVGGEEVDDDIVWMRQTDERQRRHEPSQDEESVPWTWGVTRLA